MTADSRDWMVTASCRRYPADMFFPHPSDVRGQNLAINICRGCPVRDLGEQYAAEHNTTHGVWAGRFHNDISGRRAYPRLRQPCGTPAAHKRHQRNGETCAVCREAKNRAQRSARV